VEFSFELQQACEHNYKNRLQYKSMVLYHLYHRQSESQCQSASPSTHQNLDDHPGYASPANDVVVILRLNQCQ
jgi:hypothetical protein